MNKSNAKEFLPLVQALADGKTIQCFNGGRWDDLHSDVEIRFLGEPKSYRIKPEPREWLVTVANHKNHKYEEGKIVESHNERQIGRPDQNDGWEYVRVREILD